METARSLRRRLDISDLARRGGLRPHSSDVPFNLEWHDGRLFISASGTGTQAVIGYTVFGLSKVVDDARIFCRSFHGSTADLVAEKFPPLMVKGSDWIATNIVERRNATDSRDMGTEIYREIEKQVPELRRWGPPGRTPRPQESRDAIAMQFYLELRRINRACKDRREPQEVLRRQFVNFEIWPAIDNLESQQSIRFGQRFARRGAWGADEMYECVGIFFNREGSTISDWCDRARKLDRERNAPA